ncbi:hypothetical protein ScPMuIL_013498 [Solemya velum]
MQTSVHAEVQNMRFSSTDAIINGGHLTENSFVGHPTTGTKLLKMENYDPSMIADVDEDESDSDHADMLDGGMGGMATLSPNTHLITGPKPGKKTKGRVKIKMEFIENKLRRYTTFSKRKTGIMKKAYELSTLTGTQVMLLVASETGHVYTFATRKLQPMITSESGKALIQTCLNTPENGQGGPGAQVLEQRMNPTGFEETELSYAVGDEDKKNAVKNALAYSTMQAAAGEQAQIQTSTPSSAITTMQVPTATPALPTVSYIPSLTHSTVTQQQIQAPTQTHVSFSSSTPKATSIPMQLPAGVPPGGIIIQPGTPITIPVQPGSHPSQASAQTIYRLSGSNQIIPLTSINSNSASSTSSSEVPSQTTMTGLPNATSASSLVSTQAGTAVTPGVVMYQTAQGIVYAPTTATLQDRSIFNFQQQGDQQGQQVITIPVPVSIAGGTQVLQLAAPAAVTSTESLITDLSQPPASKKSRK